MQFPIRSLFLIYSKCLSRIPCFCAVFLVLWAVCAPLCTAAEKDAATSQDAKKFVVVGFYDSPGFQEYNILSGGFSGFAVEYLQHLARFAGWRLHFVNASYAECMQMLGKGEVDIVAGVPQNAETAHFVFPKTPWGITGPVLYTRQNDLHYTHTDVSKLNGITVGLLANSPGRDTLEHYTGDRGITFETQLFDTRQKLIHALQTYSVDAILLPSFYHEQDVRPVLRLRQHPSYYAMRPGAEALAKEFDEACEQMLMSEPMLAAELHSKYYPHVPEAMPVFSAREETFISTSGIIDVYYHNDWSPYSTRDKDGNMVGIMQELFSRISMFSGLRFRFLPLQESKIAGHSLNWYALPVCAGMSYEQNSAAAHGMLLTRPFMNAPVVLIKNPRVQSGNVHVPRVAIPETGDLREVLYKVLPEAELHYLPSLKDCFEAVRAGEVDYTITNSYLSHALMQDSEFARLSAINVSGQTQQIALGIGKGENPALLDIFNKCLSCFNEGDILNIVLDNSTKREKTGLLEFVYLYPAESVFVIAAITIVIIALLCIIIFSGRRSAARISRMLNTDEVTGIWSYAHFTREAEKALAEGRLSNSVLLYCDIKKFKLINHTYGYDVGNSILRGLCAAFLDNMHPEEMFARVHSDHFIGLLLYSTEEVLHKRLQKIFHRIDELSPNRMNVTLCVGAYVIEKNELTISAAIEKANYARAHAVDSFESEIVMYDESFRERLAYEKDLNDSTKEAVERNEFKVYFQPKVDCTTGKLVGAEALVRWISPDKGMIMPSTFIPLFEKTGFILSLDFIVCRKTCELIAEWQRQGLDVVPVSVNFSTLHFLDNNFVDHLVRIVDEVGIAHNLIELEVTESVAMRETKTLLHQFEMLHKQGFSIAIDDFGTGYSSLAMLANLPVDVVKLDRRFIRDLTTGKNDATMLNGIVTMLLSIGKQVICEGGENELQISHLNSIGCRVMQGYFYSRPLSPQDFVEYMKAGPHHGANC